MKGNITLLCKRELQNQIIVLCALLPNFKTYCQIGRLILYWFDNYLEDKIEAMPFPGCQKMKDLAVL
jgi:hypothetical protein